MDQVEIEINSIGGTRASEILADLRTVVETLYFPMTLSGFWDHKEDLHLCPDEERKQECSHFLSGGDFDLSGYELAISRQRQVSLRVGFKHASLFIYLT